MNRLGLDGESKMIRELNAISYFISGIAVLSTLHVYVFNTQVALTSPDSKYVTIFNQIDPDKEAALKVSQVMEQQERDRKRS